MLNHSQVEYFNGIINLLLGLINFKQDIGLDIMQMTYRNVRNEAIQCQPPEMIRYNEIIHTWFDLSIK